MGNLSLLNVASKLASAFRRFPLAAVFFAVLTGCALYAGHNEPEPRNLFLLLYYPATAAVLNIVLRLQAESCSGRRCGTAGYIPDIVVNCLWLAIALIYRGAFPLSVSWAASAAALAAALFLLVFLIQFSRRNPDDLGFWNHTVDTAQAMIVALVSGGILAGGLSLLLLAFEMLFDLEIGWKLYRDVTVVSFALIAPLVFLQSCPEPAGERLSRTDRPGRNVLRLINFLFIPLVCAYLLTLYVYAGKIVVEAELPRGWVSVLVSISMGCMLLLVFFLYPVRFRKESSRFDRSVLKYLPAVFLPLLVLMTVGIARRLSDYGVTILRLYLLIFNIWCYVVCIGLIINRSKRIWWIPASFLAVLLTASVGPQNVSSVTKRMLVREVKEIVRNSPGGRQLPLDHADFNAVVLSVDSAAVRTLTSKLLYLMDTYTDGEVSVVLGNTVRRRDVMEVVNRFGNEGQDRSYESYHLTVPYDTEIPVPDGYPSVSEIDFSVSSPISDTIEVDSPVRFSIPSAVLKSLDGSNAPYWIDCEEGRLCILLMDFSGTDNYSLHIRGLLFKK
ncbi:MAG: DUF4153 domain-containing protein [Candidatus Cryptobacteroides sp.]